MPTQQELSSQLHSELTSATEKLKAHRFPWIVFIVVSLLLGGLFAISLYAISPQEYGQKNVADAISLVGISLVSGAFYGFIVAGIYYYVHKWRLVQARSDILSRMNSVETQSLQGDLSEDFFTNLIRINFKYLDKYYLQTQIQADKSFNVTLAVAIAGFVLVSIGIIVLLVRPDIKAGYITTGTGLISQFIATVFFYLYNDTIAKMGDYHQKLVLTQNASLAIKIADGLQEPAKSEAQKQLVEYLAKDINVYLGSVGSRVARTDKTAHS